MMCDTISDITEGSGFSYESLNLYNATVPGDNKSLILYQFFENVKLIPLCTKQFMKF